MTCATVRPLRTAAVRYSAWPRPGGPAEPASGAVQRSLVDRVRLVDLGGEVLVRAVVEVRLDAVDELVGVVFVAEPADRLGDTELLGDVGDLGLDVGARRRVRAGEVGLVADRGVAVTLRVSRDTGPDPSGIGDWAAGRR